MAADPIHGYSNESERDNENIYDFKLKKPFGFHGLYKNTSALSLLKTWIADTIPSNLLDAKLQNLFILLNLKC